MSVRIEGLEGLADELESTRGRAATFDGDDAVAVSDLFTDGFMQTHTEFASIGEFFEESPWRVETDEDFERLPEAAFDDYVADHTGFNSWEAMLSTAGREWALRELSE